MGFNLAVFENVQDRQIMLAAEVATYENRSMTGEGVFLRTHERDSVVPYTLSDALQAVPEGVCISNSIIPYPALGIVAKNVRRSPAQFFAEKDVGDVEAFQFLAERFAVELRMQPAIRRGAHIADRRDPMFLQQIQEFRKRMYRVPNCIESMAHHAFSVRPPKEG